MIKKTVFMILSVIFFLASATQSFSFSGRLADLPETAAVLFVANPDPLISRFEIYSMDINGENITRLTFTQDDHSIMGIDRSRRYIVTSVTEVGSDHKTLFLLDLKTKLEIRLTSPRNHAEGRRFSPDGEWIVFLMKFAGENQVDIYKIRRDGTSLINLTNTPNATEGDPAWSNDGKAIAYTYLDGDTKRFLLKTMDTNGKKIKTIYDGGPGVSVGNFPPGNYDPSWSPNGHWLIFERAIKASNQNWGSGIWHIFRINKNSHRVRDISVRGRHTDRAEYLPSFSPCGKYILFGSLYEDINPQLSHNDVFVMDKTGLNLRRFASDKRLSKMFPVWIPPKERALPCGGGRIERWQIF